MDTPIVVRNIGSWVLSAVGVPIVIAPAMASIRLTTSITHKSVCVCVCVCVCALGKTDNTPT